jgi:predicted DNA-binding transcriptional regulator YafY
VRTFAVDRIGAAELAEETFRVPDAFDFDAYTASAFGVVAEPATPVRIRFEPRYALHVEERVWHPSQRVERLAGGGVELALEVGGHEELRSWILSFGSGAEVLEPASLRSEVEAELGRALGRYAGAAPTAGRPTAKRARALPP